MHPDPRSSFRFVLPFAVLAATALATSGYAIEVRLVALPGSATELKSETSLVVEALPAPLNQPVTKGTLLVEMDLRKLQKELEGLNKDLASAQAEKRRLSTERGATTGTASSQSRNDLATAQAVNEALMAESNAMSDITNVQTELAIANLRAPADGYVQSQLYAVGAKTKRHKPLLVFVEAAKTVVEATLPAAEAAPFAVGATLRIADAADPARAFHARVLAAERAGDSVALRIQPLDLPFLALDAAANVNLTAAP